MRDTASCAATGVGCAPYAALWACIALVIWAAHPAAALPTSPLQPGAQLGEAPGGMCQAEWPTIRAA